MQHSPRLLLPIAVCEALRELIRVEPDSPSETRARLKTLLGQVARLYRLREYYDITECDVMQEVAEQDGEAIEDTI